MSEIDLQYSRLLKHVLTFGEHRPNRTGVDTIAVPSAMFQYDMKEGFPILHKKKVSFKTSKVELIGFLLGIRDKHWYQERGCTIWDEWCNPYIIPSSIKTKEELKSYMLKERDLGPIYGAQWRNFNGAKLCGGRDQIAALLYELETNPDSRRMIVSAWNPLELPFMALPPCHFSFQVLVINNTMHLNWNQRSVDLFLGLPYNICFYGLLLECLACQFGYSIGMLTGFLGDTHIYMNHLDQVHEYLDRPNPENCTPFISKPNTLNILSEDQMMRIKINSYNPLPAIKADVAI